MVEQVGTNKVFNLAVDDLIVQALGGLGGEHITHEEARRARTCLNLIFIDLQNLGFAPLASMQTVQVALASGSSEGYQLSSDVFDVLDAVIRDTTVSGKPLDIPLKRISMTQWLDIPTKYTPGRPTQFTVQKTQSGHLINFWPTPNLDNTYLFYSWTLKKIADVDASYQLVDLPTAYLPAIVLGLKHYMSDFRSPSGDSRTDLMEKQWNKQNYMEALDKAVMNDRERTDFNVYPSRKPLMRH